MTTQMFDSKLVNPKQAAEVAMSAVEQEAYDAPAVRQVGTLGDVQGCACGTSCDCSGNYVYRG